MLVSIELEQRGNVVGPITQGGGADGQHIDAVIQVLTKTPSRDFGFEVFVGGCDHTHIDWHFTRSANGQDAALLQDPQQLDLHVHRQIADFVQKQGAAMGQLETTKAVGNSTGEGAFAVAKQLAFDQLTRDGPAVDGHKGATGAGTLGMQGLGHQLFTSPAFAGDQGCGGGSRQSLDELAQELRRSTLSNDLGFGAGFHVFLVLDGARWLEHLPIGQLALKA